MRQALDELQSMPEELKRTIQYFHVHGDVPFGIHNALPQPSVYITMLRHPVNRIISLYYFLRRRPDTPYHRYAMQVGVREFVESDHGPTTGNNNQVRRIAGFHPGEPLPAHALDLAKEHLHEHFAVVGLTPRFDESLLLLAKRFGWTRQEMLYSRRQIGANKPDHEAIPQDVVDLIRERNELDIKLYEYGEELFRSAVREQGPTFEQELRTFRNELAAFNGQPAVVLRNRIYALVTGALPRIRSNPR